MSIGANILAPWVADRAAMFDWLVKANPGAVVVCDEPNIAAQVKSTLPNTSVVHRWIREGDGSFTNWTPAQYINDFVRPLPAGVMGYVLNEPGGEWAALASYLVTIMRLVAPMNIPLVLGNFSKGNPPRAVVDAGLLDNFLMAFNEFPINWFGYHPYFSDDPATDEHANWHTVILNRAAKIGAHVRLMATEAGRDQSGAYNDGYHSHMTSAAFAEKLTRQARTLDQYGINMTPFCYGTGGPIRVLGIEVHHWENFDFQADLVVKNAIAAYNASGREEDEVAVWGLKRVQTKAAGANVNMRYEPKLTAPVLRTVKTGDYLRPYGTPVSANGHSWQRVNDENCTTGWVSLNVLELV